MKPTNRNMSRTGRVTIDVNEDDLDMVGITEPEEEFPYDIVKQDTEFYDEETDGQIDALADKWISENGHRAGKVGDFSEPETKTTTLTPIEDIVSEGSSKSPVFEIVRAKQDYISGVNMAKAKSTIRAEIKGISPAGIESFLKNDNEYRVDIQEAKINYENTINEFEYFNLLKRGNISQSVREKKFLLTNDSIKKVFSCAKKFSSIKKIRKEFYSLKEKADAKYESTISLIDEQAAEKMAAAKNDKEIRRIDQKYNLSIQSAGKCYEEATDKICEGYKSKIKKAEEEIISGFKFSPIESRAISKIKRAFENFIADEHPRYALAAAAALAVDSLYRGGVMDNKDESIACVFKELDAMRLVGGIVKSIRKGAKSIPYSDLKESVKNTMKYNLSNPYYEQCAAVPNGELKKITEYITVKLIESGVFSAGLSELKNLNGAVENRLFLTVNDKYFSKWQDGTRIEHQSPKQVSGFF